jgi:tripartite-type tricarboxylate transporter receptor subunit TctC
MNRRVLTSVLVAAICVFAVVTAAFAADYPEREIRIVVPFSAGGTLDTATRQLQPAFSEQLGVPIIVDNRSGAGGQLGTTLAVKEKQDGYVIGGMASPHLEFLLLLRDPEFNVADFAWIGGLTADPACVRVHKDAPWDTLNDLIEDARSKPPESITFGVSSIFSDNYVGIKTIEEATGVKFRIVDFGGGGPSRVALVGKQIDAVHTNVFSSLHIATESKVLAVQADQNRYKDITDNAPTVTEALGKEVPSLATRTLFFTTTELKNNHPDRYEFLVNAFQKAVASEMYRSNMEKLGRLDNIDYLTPEELDAMVRKNLEVLGKFKNLWEEQ